MVHGAGGLKRTVNFSPVQPGQKVIGFDVHQLHLIGIIEHTVRHAFAHCNACNSGYNVVQAFQMLNIHGGVHINAKRSNSSISWQRFRCRQPSALVWASSSTRRRAGRRAMQRPGQIRAASRFCIPRTAEAAVPVPPAGRAYPDACEARCIRPQRRFPPRVRVCGFQHGVGFSHARSIAEEYLQSAAHMRRIGPLLLDLMQNRSGSGLVSCMKTPPVVRLLKLEINNSANKKSSRTLRGGSEKHVRSTKQQHGQREQACKAETPLSRRTGMPI